MRASTSRVRFLHVVERRVHRGGAFVDELTVDGERYVAWEEATEREVGRRADGRLRSRFRPASARGRCATASALVRRWRALRGRIEVFCEELRGQGFTA